MSSSESKQLAVPVNLRPSLPVILATAPSGQKLPRMMRMWPVALIGFEIGWTTSWPAGEAGQLGQVLGDRLAGDREAVAVEQAVLRAAASSRPACRRLCAGLPARTCRWAAGRRGRARGRSTVWKSSIVSGTPTARAMAMRCSTALVEPPTAITIAIAFSNASRVMTSRGLMSFSSKLRITSPARRHSSILSGSSAGMRRAVGQRHAQGFDRGGHRVGGVHAAAGAGAGAGMPDDLAALGVGHLAGQLRAVARERGDDVDRLAGRRVAGADRAAVDHEAGAIEPAQRHERSRACSCRSREATMQASYHWALHDGFDRVGDEVARLERVAHAVGAHRDAVGDADRVEPHADEPGRHDALLHLARRGPAGACCRGCPRTTCWRCRPAACCMSSSVRPVA